MKTKSQYFKDIRDLLGEKYGTEMFDDSFLLSQINDAKTIMNYFKGGKWDWALTTLITPITTPISEITLPANYNTDMKVSYGTEELTATPLGYVVPANYQAFANEFTIKGNKIIFKELSSGNVYVEYYKKLDNLILAQDLSFPELPMDLDIAIINYAVGMGFRKKRQFNSAIEYLGDEANSKRYPNSFWTILRNYAENHILGKTRPNLSFRPNPLYA